MRPKIQDGAAEKPRKGKQSLTNCAEATMRTTRDDPKIHRIIPRKCFENTGGGQTHEDVSPGIDLDGFIAILGLVIDRTHIFLSTFSFFFECCRLIWPDLFF